MSPNMTDERSQRTPWSRRALLAGGGSGGHVFPALAVGDELVRRGWGVALAGSPTGMEARLAAERGCRSSLCRRGRCSARALWAKLARS